MKFTEAFRGLGYEVAAPRTDWSAGNETGICLSLWAKEIKYSKDGCSFDTRWDAQPIETWNHKPGFKRRLDHMKRAMDEFEGSIDVVIVSGTPGESYGDAFPWKPEERKQASWRILELDRNSGHFSAEAKV